MKYFYVRKNVPVEDKRDIAFEDFTSQDSRSFLCPFCSACAFEVYTDHSGRTTLFCRGCKHSIHLLYS